MKTIFDVITPADTKAYFENTPRNPRLGETLFPTTKQLGLDLSFLKGRGGLPVSLQPAAFDALAPLRERIGVEGFNTEMPFFRERMLVKEKERQQINTFLSGGQTNQANLIIQEVYKDAQNLIEGAYVVQERMRMQLLATGKITIQGTEERRAVNYNYQLDPSQFETLTGTSTWDNAAATPLDDIETWQESVLTSVGEKPTRAITNTVTFNLLRKHPSVIAAVTKVTGRKSVTKTEVMTYLKEEYDLTIAVYDEQFKTAVDGAAEKYFPDFVFTLIPAGTLGETVYGTTPEESDLMTGSEAEVEIVDKGIAVTRRKHTHPVNVETIVSEIVLPSFPQADKIFIATVGM